MLARVVRVQFQTGKLDEATRIVRDEIVPEMKEQQGFEGQLLLTQEETGSAVSLNLWETAEDLDAFETGDIYRELMGRLAGVLAGPPTGERYTVSVQA